MTRPLTFAAFSFAFASIFLASCFTADLRAQPSQHPAPVVIVKHVEAMTAPAVLAPSGIAPAAAPVASAPVAKELHEASRAGDAHAEILGYQGDQTKRKELCRRLERRREELRQQARQRNAAR